MNTPCSSLFLLLAPVLLLGSLCLGDEAQQAKDAVDNLLKPTNKLESWRFEQHEGGKGTMKVDEDMLVLNVSAVDGTDWHVQASQVGLDLAEGKEYVLTFEIKADANRLAKVDAMIDEEDWHNLGLTEEMLVTREFKKREFTFRADGVVAKKNRISFMVGSGKGTIFLKNAVLKEKR